MDDYDDDDFLDDDFDPVVSLTKAIIKKGIKIAIEFGKKKCKEFFQNASNNDDAKYASIKKVRKSLKKLSRNAKYSYDTRQKLKSLRKKLKKLRRKYKYITLGGLKSMMEDEDII